MDLNVLKHSAGQHKIFLQAVSSALNHYFSTFAVDIWSLYIRLKLSSSQLRGKLHCRIKMCASQSLSVKNKTTCGRRRAKRQITKVTETIIKTLNKALMVRKDENFAWQRCALTRACWVSELKRQLSLMGASNEFLLFLLQGVWWLAAQGWFSCSRSVLILILLFCHSCYLSFFPVGLRYLL